ncbi:hypothetical protein Ciccas_000006 [Cichlidogyrus casuarinus]|uniref:Very long-chain specific acyl-CoA dehydrogenase, mitochondrial n=1 Tax=Cichlidogyrus casuarinus TaxID=1844966 RepID=A0ABD2QP55_9PLAT
MFRGKLCTKELLPFPKGTRTLNKFILLIIVLSSERVEFISQMIDPVEKFLATENDPYKNDETEKFDPKTVEGLKELGAFGLQVPEEYDGVGLCNTEYARVVSIVGLTDLALGIFLGSHQSIGYKGILLYGTEEQKKKYLPDLASGRKLAAYCLTEPMHGSDASSIKTKAVLSPDGKHYIMNGSKVWISNGGWADVFTVFAKVPVTDKDGQTKDKMTGFIVERGFGGLKHSEPEKKMGIKASNTVSLYFEDCKIPVENVLGEVGQGFKVAVNILNQGRFGMASALSGTMRTAIGKAADFASQRHQFDRHIKDFESVREKIAMMCMRQYATESMAFMVSGIMDLGAKDFQVEAAISKIYSSEAAWFCVDEAIQIHGGMGFMRETQLERVLRDLRVFRIFEGANDVLRLFVTLTAMNNAGKHLAASAKSPGGLLSLFSSSMKTKLGLSPSASEFAGKISPTLADASKLIGENVDKIAWTVFNLLRVHKKAIIEEQYKLTRLADAGHAVTKRSLEDIDGSEQTRDLVRSVSKEVFDHLGMVPKSPIGV